MDSPLSKQKPEQNDPQDSQEYPWLLRHPLGLFSNMLGTGLRLFRPYIPQLVPLVVFLLAIPALLLCSMSAGWLVWRSVAVGWETSLYLQYGDGVPPYTETYLPSLVDTQPYDISLHLIIPTTSANLELGNFMATFNLLDVNNQTIASVRRPALVSLHSSMPWSWIGTPHKVELDIPLLSNFVVGQTKAFAFVELGRKDQWRSLGRGEGRELSVLHAFLRGVVVHRGLRGIVTRFPMITAFVSAGFFFFISFVVLASCLLPMIEWRLQGEADYAGTQSNPAPSLSKRESTRWAQPTTPRKREPRRARSFRTPSHTDSAVKPEAEIKMEETDSTSASSTPLRRRRSRVSQVYDDD